MSSVTSAIILVGQIEDLSILLGPVLEPPRWPQSFKEVDSAVLDTLSEGWKSVEFKHVLAAGLNHIDTTQISEWFLSREWARHDNAILITYLEGEGFNTVHKRLGWSLERG